MLSICIPIYNFDITNLVTVLSKQIKACSIPAELILIDDCSDLLFKEVNDTICKDHKYIELKKNIGRSKIRNLFLDYASYDYLLFLDCDSLIISDHFLQKYITAYTQTKANVICGGRIYERIPPNKNQMLSWKYGVKKESKHANEREKSPYSSFMTNNFLVYKQVLEHISFDESLSKYGHEDTLFGYSLKQEKVVIKHINNPVLNGDVEENAVYLEKTKLAIDNLSVILCNVEDKKGFINEVTLLAFYQKIKGKRLLGIVLLFAPIINTTFFLLLKLGVVSLILFNYYKLSYLAKVLNKKKS
jgi:glycosyltransferase involved in cell wall biosynthesis